MGAVGLVLVPRLGYHQFGLVPLGSHGWSGVGLVSALWKWLVRLPCFQ